MDSCVWTQIGMLVFLDLDPGSSHSEAAQVLLDHLPG